MSRNYAPSRGKNRTAEARSHAGALGERHLLVKFGPTKRPNRRVLVMDKHHKLDSRKSWNEGLNSALLAQDKKLARILQEVDDISKDLKSNPPDAQILSEALHRTVLCAIRQSILETELRSLALRDDLTSLYNRRAFYALSTQQLKVMSRKGQGLLLFFADVDHLKYINDTFGHREGDLALLRTANALEQTFRNSDILARLGGDEFAVLALEASSQDEEAILRRLEGHLQKASAEEDRYQLSLSVGVAKFDPRHGASLEDLITKADQEMYGQKSRHHKMKMSSI
jgi:diguanylate cyclase (GGDEF)-like protein